MRERVILIATPVAPLDPQPGHYWLRWSGEVLRWTGKAWEPAVCYTQPFTCE